MAYRFTTRDASITDGLRRIAAEEFSQVSAALADKSMPVERKVHEGRKATKRLRALLRLTAPVFPGAHEEITTLRAAAAQLSALRDKGALGETLATLDLAPPVAAALGEAFATSGGLSAPSQRKLLAAFGREMKAVAERAPGWTLDKDGWKALAPGLTRCQHRLRKSMAAAISAKSEDPVHEFRKRAKDYWYQSLLLRGAFPDVMDGYARAGESLCNDLGDWRDLGLLEEAIKGAPDGLLSKRDAKATRELVAKSRKRALRSAFRTSQRLAWESPDDHAARLKAWRRIAC